MSETMEQRRDALYKRLEAGYERIATALKEGREVAVWERVWLNILQEYEAVCDELAGEQAAEAERRRAGAQGQAALFGESVGRRGA